MTFENFTVKGRLTFAFGLLAALVMVVSITAVHALSGTNENFTRYSRVNVAQAQLVTDVENAVNRRAVAARNLVLVTTPQDLAKEKEAVLVAHQDTKQGLAKLNAALQSNPQTSSEELRLVKEIDRVESLYGPVALDIVQLALDGKREEAIAKMNSECRPLLAALIKAALDYQRFSNRAGDESVANAAADYASARWLMMALCAVAVVAAIVLGILITSSLVRALGGEPNTAASVARAVSQGDLTVAIAVKSGDAGSLMAQLKLMQESLARVVSSVRQGAEGVSTASVQIAQGNQDLSGRTEHQASALEETAASMEQLSGTVKQNAENAHQANRLAQTASSVAVKGGEVVGQVVETMKGINDSSKKIADIISVIDGIAFQTNILALNAAVEAARAGEQGRGFAVVASEVRSLAQRSAGAAKEIKALIDSSVRQVEQGATLVATAGATMAEVVTAIRRVSDVIGEVSVASHEQSRGVSQVGEAIARMDQVTQQNAALVEESAAAAGSLSTQAQQLLQTVATFKLADAGRHALGAQVGQVGQVPVPRDAAPSRPRLVAKNPADSSRALGLPMAT